MHAILKLLVYIALVGELNSSTTLNFNRRNTLSNMLFSEGALETMALNRFAAKLCAVIIALAQQCMFKKRSNLDWTLPRREEEAMPGNKESNRGRDYTIGAQK